MMRAEAKHKIGEHASQRAASGGTKTIAPPSNGAHAGVIGGMQRQRGHVAAGNRQS